METLERISDRLDTFNEWVGRFSAWMAIPIVTIIMLDVITRRFLTLGSVTLQELEWHFHAVLFLFCLGYAYIHDAHVRVDIFRAKADPLTRAWIEFLGSAVFLVPYSVMMIYLGWQFVGESYALGETSDAPGGLPYRWVIKSALPIGFTFLLIQGVSTALRQFVMIQKLQPGQGGE